MLQEAGYNGQKAVIINPTDFATIGPLGDITYDMFKKIGINAELQDTDWGSVVQRRATREPVENGGWSAFHTWFTVASSSIRSSPRRSAHRVPRDGSAGMTIRRSSS
jgi:ABC-type transport system substrate-binding protein